MTETQTTRDMILERGQALMLTSGFAGLGLSTLLKAAGVPKGSFYHWFDSKEDFGRAAIEAYSEGYLDRLDVLLTGPGTGADKLDRFFSAWLTNAAQAGLAERCLVVKLGAEVSDLSEPMRVAMDRGVAQFVARLAGLLTQGAEDGSLRSLDDPLAEARRLYATLLGAAILTRISRDDSALRDATQEARARLRV
ncbi:TetR/AcrR family transcriptional regulator [Mameliella alba]|nr:TetR/AcrR family transcriptional regulator [Mameliella alba]MBY6171097.1 TetR/AcrR family transcriptional regulator [Mameliella alba]MBY6176321.1 TetR/AcrR family transcriptional regulator [Mameliella alba]